MELDDLKNTWNELSTQVNTQQHLNASIINEMTKHQYNTRLKKIAYPEIIGVFICLAGLVYVVLHFWELNTAFLQATGIVAILVLLLLSITSLLSLQRLNTAVDVNKTYAETLKDFATKKIQFYKLQKINVTLSYLLLVTIIVLFSKFFSNKDITGSKYFWIFSFSIGYIFLMFYSKWVAKFYRSTLRKAEDLLNDLAA